MEETNDNQLSVQSSQEQNFIVPVPVHQDLFTGVARAGFIIPGDKIADIKALDDGGYEISERSIDITNTDDPVRYKVSKVALITYADGSKSLVALDEKGHPAYATSSILHEFKRLSIDEAKQIALETKSGKTPLQGPVK
jgi:hypothetical protein